MRLYPIPALNFQFIDFSPSFQVVSSSRSLLFVCLVREDIIPFNLTMRCLFTVTIRQYSISIHIQYGINLKRFYREARSPFE